ncbi:MAG: orotidine-5'-phosphate decarboxylase [bacterium]
MTFKERLERAVRRSRLCVGIDPVPEKLPRALRGRRDGIVIFIEEIVRATAPWAAAYKPNFAFFEALGKQGEEALQRAIEAVRDMAPHAVLIGDGKRGDIGSTAERYAIALFERWGFDAATVNPWFGADGVKPFTERPEKGVYLLAATSNPSSVEVQEAAKIEDSLPVRIARLAETQWNEHDNVGLVVGATRVEIMAAVRSAAPRLPWLIPGVGAQGGDLESALMHGVGSQSVSSVVNASRSILYASAEDDFAEAAEREARMLARAIEKATTLPVA